MKFVVLATFGNCSFLLGRMKICISCRNGVASVLWSFPASFVTTVRAENITELILERAGPAILKTF